MIWFPESNEIFFLPLNTIFLNYYLYWKLNKLDYAVNFTAPVSFQFECALCTVQCAHTPKIGLNVFFCNGKLYFTTICLAFEQAIELVPVPYPTKMLKIVHLARHWKTANQHGVIGFEEIPCCTERQFTHSRRICVKILHTNTPNKPHLTMVIFEERRVSKFNAGTISILLWRIFVLWWSITRLKSNETGPANFLKKPYHSAIVSHATSKW